MGTKSQEQEAITAKIKTENFMKLLERLPLPSVCSQCSMWDEEWILGSLNVTPEQGKMIFRVGMKNRNNRLVTDGPATSYGSM